MTDIERLIAIEDIRTLFARRLRYMDQRQWHLYTALHTEDAVSETYGDGKPRLLGITKRGSRYLRKNLIQGTRASLPTMSKSDTAWCLAARPAVALPPEHRRRGTGRQDGAHRLGAAAS